MTQSELGKKIPALDKNKPGYDSAVDGVEEKDIIESKAFGLNLLRIARAKYDFSVDGGAIGTITPSKNADIPDNAVIVGATINPTTAVTSGGAATVAVGTSAGSSTTALLAATAKTALSLDALVNGVPVFATPIKLSASGKITLTVATAALTAGVIEVAVYYYVAAN